jgi:outer membrane autotransporter protein
MTQKNRKRNLLAVALATSSIATFILGVSNKAFATPEARIANTNPAKTDTGDNWNPLGPVVNGDSLIFTAATNSIESTSSLTYTLNVAAVPNANLSTTGVTGIAGIVGSTAGPLTINAGGDIILGTNGLSVTDFAGDLEVGKYNTVPVTLNLLGNNLTITTKDFDAPNIQVVGDNRGQIDVGTATKDTTGVVLYANQFGTMNKLIVNNKSDVTISDDLNLAGINPYVELQGAGGTINIAAGKNVQTEIKGKSSGNGNVNFLGSSTVTKNLGSTKLNSITLANNSIVTFSGDTIAANILVLSNGQSVLSLTNTNSSTITAAITGNGQIISSTPTLNIVGNVGDSISTGALNSFKLTGSAVTALNFNPSTHVNINAVDLNSNNVTVGLNTIGDSYRFGNMTNAQNATISLAQDSTIQDTSGTVKTIVGNGKTLTIKSVNSNTDLKWTDYMQDLVGLTLESITNKTITLSGDIGTSSASVVTPITVNANSSVNYNGNIYITGGITLGNGAALTLNGGEYDVQISGNSDGNGNVTFVGNSTVKQNLGSTNKLNSITLGTSSDVSFSGGTIVANSLAFIDATSILRLSNATNTTITAAITGNGQIISSTPILNIVGNVGNSTLNSAGALNLLQLGNGATALNFTPAAPTTHVNINAVNLANNTMTVGLQSAASYRFGNMTNAQNATISLAQDSTIQDTSGTIKTIVGNGKTLTIKSVNSDTDLKWNTTISDLGGLILGSAAGKTITLSGDIDTSGTSAATPITINANSSVNYNGNIYSTGGITLGATSTLALNGKQYQLAAVNGATPGDGTLRFAGGGTSTLVTTTATTDAIGTISVDSTSVTLDGAGIKFNNIEFASSNGIKPILTLPTGASLNSVINITSTAGANIPELRVNADQNISRAVGSSGNPVNIRMFSDNTVTVLGRGNFYSQITTNTDGQGVAVLSRDGVIISGLGEQDKMLQSVTFRENTINFGNTYATNSVINDDKTVALGRTVAGTVTLGNTIANGATLILNDQVSLVGNVVAFAGSTGTSKLEFLGSVNQIGTIGTSGTRITEINFDGIPDSVANLSNGSIYGTTIKFNDTKIDVSGGSATLSGTSNVNANINLGSNQLTFQDNQGAASIWGANTSISTNVSANGGTVTAGRINVNNVVNVTANSTIVVNAVTNPGLPLNYTTALIPVNGGTVSLNGATFKAAGNNAYASYTVQSNGSGGYNLVSSDGSSTVVPQDFVAAGVTDPTDMANAQLLQKATSGDAARFVADTGLIDPAIRANAFQRLTNSNITQITAVSQNLVLGTVDTLGTRMSDTALQVDRNELGLGAPTAAGDDDEKIARAPIGAWLSPVYSQANQKAKGGNPGYKVKSGGGIFGIDTQANDNLVIGLSATVLSSDMKMKDFKAGDKARINTFMFSLYGAQELVRNFFVQGIASFSSNKIKGKEHRLVPTTTNANGYQIANSNYSSMGLSGQVLFGYNAKPREGVFVTPVVGVRYSKINNEAYNETGTLYQNKPVRKYSTNKVEGIIGVQVETNVKIQSLALVPEAHAYVTQKLNGKSGTVYSTLDGLNNTSFIARNDTTGKTFYNAGLGVKAMSGAMEYGAGYDAYFASKYIAHQGSLKVRVNF